MAGRVELVFGLVGPIGCKIHEAREALEDSLMKVGYKPITISLSKQMDNLLKIKGKGYNPTDTSQLANKIEKGNQVRETFDDNGILAVEAIRQILNFRKQIISESKETDPKNLNDLVHFPIDEHAFIIDQLKRPEEIEQLVDIFGKRFVQVSVVTPIDSRRQSLVSRLSSEQHGWNPKKCEDHANELILRDQRESDLDHGQMITKIFHLGDVFLNGISDHTLATSSDRFIQALFGRNNISPTADEFGSYMAKTVALRSTDLSRQVGATILTAEGDLVAMGCNEVPKYGGGNHWDDDENRRRDIDLGSEANKNEINRIVFDFLDLLIKQDLLTPDKSVEDILADKKVSKAIKDSLISEVTEYGRMVHAEMSALTEAARLGRPVKGTTIFVTTYPCHNCAKHLIASGVERIVYIEPYPKSKVERLFQNIVVPDDTDGPTVSIEHFFGISPRRYRDIFEKSGRQNKDGSVQKWYQNKREPRLGNVPIGPSGVEVNLVSEKIYKIQQPSPPEPKIQ